MNEVYRFLEERKLPVTPEPYTVYVPEDARTAQVIPCMMGTATCETPLTPLDTTCACGFRTFRPKVGFKLVDLDQYPV